MLLTELENYLLFSSWINIIFLFTDYINRLSGLWVNDAYKYLFYSHVALGLLTLTYILVYNRIKAQSSNEMTLVHKFYVIFFASFLLSLSAIISGWIDQKIHAQIYGLRYNMHHTGCSL